MATASRVPRIHLYFSHVLALALCGCYPGRDRLTEKSGLVTCKTCRRKIEVEQALRDLSSKIS